MDKYNIVDPSFTNTIIDVNSPISADMMSAEAINDVLGMRDQKNTNFTSDELNQLLLFFCLDNYLYHTLNCITCPKLLRLIYLFLHCHIVVAIK